MDNNSNTKSYEKPSPPLIFIYAAIGILITIVVIHYVTGAEYRDEKDIFNWVSLVAEVGIGVGIAIVVWRYTKFEKSKTDELLLNISQVTTKLDKIINEQNTLQTSRKKFLHESLYGNLISILTSAYNISQGQTIRKLVLPDGTKIAELNEYILLDQMLDVLKERIQQFNDIMEPELYASLSTVCNLLSEKGMGEAYAKGIIQQAKRGLNAIDTSLFSIKNIANTEILDKV